MSYTLNDETSIDTLIFWIESTDGSISYTEQKAVKRVLENMDYDMATYQQTLAQIGAMSTEKMQATIDKSIDYVVANFSEEGKKLTYQLLDNIATCDGHLSDAQKTKLELIKNKFGI